MKPRNISGKRFGRLVALSISYQAKNEGTVWLCQCDCGKLVSVVIGSLSTGRTKSCGCLKSDVTRERLTTHGQCASPEYIAWSNMRQRCDNPCRPEYPDYGGRGIKVCERWTVFENFLADMGKRPDGKSIERRNNEGNYEPLNCVWATKIEQTRNTRRNHKIAHRGETKCLTEWVNALGLNYERVRGRLRIGWSFEEAIK